MQNFGVNLTRLAPGSMSALRHAHSKQDEFVYILGMCAGFRAGTGDGHPLVNRTATDVLYRVSGR